MKKILILAAALLALSAWTVAFADTPSESSTVTVVVPSEFIVDITGGSGAGAADVTFVVSDADAQSTSGATETSAVLSATIKSNHDSTLLQGSATHWAGTNDAVGAEPFGLWAQLASAGTGGRAGGAGSGAFHEMITAGAPGSIQTVSLGAWDDNGVNDVYGLQVRITGIGIEDDPGTYTSTVTWTIS